MATYFPRGQQKFSAIKKKFLEDLAASAESTPEEFVFVTNQELTLGEREELRGAACEMPVELYHLERITAILDKPAMAGVRKQFLDLEFIDTWPEPAVGGDSLEHLATQVEFALHVRVEVLMRVGDRLVAWLKLPSGADFDVRSTLLSAACVLSGAAGIRRIEIGLSNTSDLPHSVGHELVGPFRASFPAEEVNRIAVSKVIQMDFWKRVTAVIASGDNLRVGEIRMPYDDFEAKG